MVREVGRLPANCWDPHVIDEDRITCCILMLEVMVSSFTYTSTFSCNSICFMGFTVNLLGLTL
jgi:hypothetical protein